MGVRYTTRESVKRALDIKETARNNGQIDRAIEAASRSIELMLHRKFYPQKGTRYFDWPAPGGGEPWRLWLGENEVLSVTTLTSGTVTIDASDFNLEPNTVGPPYDRIELKRDQSASFGESATPQRDVAVVGVFGYTNATRDGGELESAIASTSTTTVSVTDSGKVGVGDLILVESEYMLVTEKAYADTGLTLSAGATLSNADDTLTVSGSTIQPNEVIRIGSERMLVVEGASTSLRVKRAWDGTALATHATSDAIYAPRSLTVTRGAVGTTAATHADATDVLVHDVPGLIETLCIAEAMGILQMELSAGAKAAEGLQTLRDLVYATYGRKARVAVI